MLPQPVPSGESRRETGLAPPQPAGDRWRHALRFFASYWTSKDWKVAWGYLLVLVAFQFSGAYVFVLMNRWQQRFFNSVEAREVAAFGGLVAAYISILALQMVFVVVEPLVKRLLCIRWRVYLTQTYVDRWLGRNRYAEIERLRMIDNPDQRIADDLRYITDPELGSMVILLDALSALVMVWATVAILLETAPPITLALFGTAISIPGSTIWYAVAYVLVSSVVMVLLGKPYIRSMMRWQHREADFRSNLVHVRRNAAQIGMANAVQIERGSLRINVENIRQSWRSVIRAQIGLNMANGLYDRLGSIIPLFILVPRYFAGAISFGQVMGGRDAFSALVPQLGFFVHFYPRMATQISYINRIKALDDAIDYERPAGITATIGTPAGVAVAVTGLTVRRPHGEPLVILGDWQVRDGERWVIRGPSGAGKSTLLRTIAGLWPDGEGQVALADRSTAMFVPQRLYLPLGTLKAAICFPDAPEDHDDSAIAALLDMVHLSHLADDMHALRMWSEELSPGEQQRVALMRILLQKPSLLILDEATSALDPANTQHFHQLLEAQLPGITLISVVHDERLHRYHDHALVIADGRTSAGPIEEIA
ncbi:ATP-binding cassette domain-containing protein [Sphingobium sp. HBC34]|uniref:ATP-binding cassette domain-containing protein n=1 Tax=Sphingobium cyanobacteriorum TaxID=3063954 RepID=A0ABT8ZR94_9SPHN|nr:ATP-binding cassette domain-containing protein [Sphingobium sp. HBC34]MDO7837072.1 ATP-binding cassette domain-containing protein [Sphingobium sp. HBC34]